MMRNNRKDQFNLLFRQQIAGIVEGALANKSTDVAFQNNA